MGGVKDQDPRDLNKLQIVLSALDKKQEADMEAKSKAKS